MEKDYIDITPKGIEDGKGIAGLTNTVFQNNEWDQIINNPGRLTKEGVKEKIILWKQSNNSHLLIKYNTMLKRCKLLAPSGKTETGEIVLSRNLDGTPNWTKKGPVEKKTVKKGDN